MTLNSWLLFWSIALGLPNNHVVLPLSMDSPLLETISHVFFCLPTSRTFSPMFMVICPTLLRKLKLSKDNFQTVSILSFLPASAPIFSHFSLLVQMSYCLSLNLCPYWITILSCLPMDITGARLSLYHMIKIFLSTWHSNQFQRIFFSILKNTS